MSDIPRGAEWAVVEFGFRGYVSVIRGGLGSREEAEAWKAALELTEGREASEALYRRDAIVTPRRLQIAWRDSTWHADAE